MERPLQNIQELSVMGFVEAARFLGGQFVSGNYLLSGEI